MGRSLEARTSLRVETGACFLALEHAKDIRALIVILTDSANHLSEIDDWIGPGRYPTVYSSIDGDILRGVLDLLHYWVNLGFPTFFVKVRAHRGEPYKEAADRIASMATQDEDVPCLWNAPSGRIIYQFTPDPSDSEDTLYLASMNDTVKKFIKNQAAVSNLYSSRPQGVTESFLRRPHSSRDLLVRACLARQIPLLDPIAPFPCATLQPPTGLCFPQLPQSYASVVLVRVLPLPSSCLAALQGPLAFRRECLAAVNTLLLGPTYCVSRSGTPYAFTNRICLPRW